MPTNLVLCWSWRGRKVNWLGVIHSIKAVLPSMKRAGFGDIVLVSSLAGQVGRRTDGRASGRVNKCIRECDVQVGLYGYTAYSSSKFALRGLAEALQMEVEQYKIRILTAFPPNTNTPLLSRENEIKPEITGGSAKILSILQAGYMYIYMRMCIHCCAGATTGILEDTTSTLEPEAVAKSILSGIRNGDAQIVTSLDGWMLGTLTCGMLRPQSLKCLLSEVELV